MAREDDLTKLKSIRVMLQSSIANKAVVQDYDNHITAALLVAVESLIDYMIERLESK